MNRTTFFLGLAILFPVFVLAVQLQTVKNDSFDLIQQAVELEIVWLALTYLCWLSTRWNRGHWNANALSASSAQRRFLLIGTLVGGVFSVWGVYLGILDRLFW